MPVPDKERTPYGELFDRGWQHDGIDDVPAIAEAISDINERKGEMQRLGDQLDNRLASFHKRLDVAVSENKSGELTPDWSMKRSPL